MNLKASLAAPDVNVINEDDRELESSSEDDAASNANAGSELGGLANRKL